MNFYFLWNGNNDVICSFKIRIGNNIYSFGSVFVVNNIIIIFIIIGKNGYEIFKEELVGFGNLVRV